ncbi:velvet factor [Gorgonomyces haynaldii]|nr:velvet factor [Gorgonomyces haynaldii]
MMTTNASQEPRPQLDGESASPFRLRMVQQPVLARMCLFTDNERRPIDPCPVVELYLDGDNGTTLSDIKTHYPFLLCRATLVSHDGATTRQYITTKNDDEVMEQNLIGSHIVASFNLKSTEGVEVLYFIFGDLSVRLEGSYRLKFELMDVAGPLNGAQTRLSQNKTSILTSVTSEPFQVVNGSKYKGPLESTPLTKYLSDQGVRLQIRNSTSRRKLASVPKK